MNIFDENARTAWARVTSTQWPCRAPSAIGDQFNAINYHKLNSSTASTPPPPTPWPTASWIIDSATLPTVALLAACVTQASETSQAGAHFARHRRRGTCQQTRARRAGVRRQHRHQHQRVPRWPERGKARYHTRHRAIIEPGLTSNPRTRCIAGYRSVSPSALRHSGFHHNPPVVSPFFTLTSGTGLRRRRRQQPDQCQ